MSLTTNIAQAVVSASVSELDGRTLTRPALLVSDSSGILLWAVDVDIGQKRVNPNTGDEEAAILKNVTIANGGSTLAGSAITRSCAELVVAGISWRSRSMRAWAANGFTR